MKDNWKTTTLLIGAAVGIFTGLLAAYILIQTAERRGVRPRITAGDGVKVGLGVGTVLKLLSELGTTN